jgi:hypothetical protein
VVSVLVALSDVYLNLDDCWMAMERASEVVAVNETLHLNNTLQPGKNFSSGMRALGQYIHSKGLLYGIYESSGTKTCQVRLPLMCPRYILPSSNLLAIIMLPVIRWHAGK